MTDIQRRFDALTQEEHAAAIKAAHKRRDERHEARRERVRLARERLTDPEPTEEDA